MRCLALVLACLVCEGYGDEMAGSEHSTSSRGELRARSPLQSLAMLLALDDPEVAWQVHGFGHPRSPMVERSALHPAVRADVPTMDIFKGLKDFFNAPDEIVTANDRITPFDRWMVNRGLMPKEELFGYGMEGQQGQEDQYVDPNDVASYFQVDLAKPMGILFAENEGGNGVCINEVVDTGSAASSEIKLMEEDQLIGVDTSNVRGLDFDGVLAAIQGTPGASAKLTFYRGPAKFLYGPTAPDDDWYVKLLSGSLGTVGAKDGEN